MGDIQPRGTSHPLICIYGCEAVTLAVIAVAVWLRWLVDMSRSTPTSIEVAGW
jgi:hypothetical protein